MLVEEVREHLLEKINGLTEHRLIENTVGICFSPLINAGVRRNTTKGSFHVEFLERTTVGEFHTRTHTTHIHV